MTKLCGDLSFITVVDNPSGDLMGVPKKAHETILGPSWGLRKDKALQKFVKDVIEYGYDNIAACKNIIDLINENRKNNENPFNSSGEWCDLYVVANDAVSGFDSEAGVNGCGSILLNMTTPAAWLDEKGLMWYVPMLLVVYHELGHYNQYVSMPEEYDEISKSKLEKESHVLDAWNLPGHEYPICKEIGMGIRKEYLDMQESSAPRFAKKVVNYASNIEEAYAKDTALRGFKSLEAPKPVRMKGAMAKTVDCEFCSKKGVNTATHFNPESFFKCKKFKFPKT